MKKNLRLLVYLLIFVFLISGCIQKVVATVNGEKITEKVLNDRLEQLAAMYGYDLESEEAKETKAFLQEQVLNSLIQETVILQNAKMEGIKFDKKSLDQQIKEYEASFDSKGEYKEYLKEYKLTQNDVKDIFYKNILIQGLFDKVTKDITKTSQDARKYYDENKEAFLMPEQVQARHILVKTEAEALEVIKKIKNGADFVQLVLEKSIDPAAKENEGLYDYFTKDADLIQEFIDASFALKNVGDITETPVKTVYGFHIIKLEGREAEKQLAFDEVKETIEQQFLLQEKNVKFEEYTNGLLEKAKIEINLPSDDPADSSDVQLDEDQEGKDAAGDDKSGTDDEVDLKKAPEAK